MSAGKVLVVQDPKNLGISISNARSKRLAGDCAELVDFAIEQAKQSTFEYITVAYPKSSYSSEYLQEMVGVLNLKSIAATLKRKLISILQG